MSNAIYKFVKSLFSTTTTTTVVETKYTNPEDIVKILKRCDTEGIDVIREYDSSQCRICRRVFDTIATDDEIFELDSGRSIPLPQIVRDMIPIRYQSIPDHAYFPITEPSDILTMFERPGSRQLFNYGDFEEGSDPVWIRTIIDTLLETSTNNDDVVFAESSCEDISIMSILDVWVDGEDYSLVTAQVFDICRLTVAVGTQKFIGSDKDVVLASIFSRAILLTMCRMGVDYEKYNELDLRSILFKMLTVDRDI